MLLNSTQALQHNTAIKTLGENVSQAAQNQYSRMAQAFRRPSIKAVPKGVTRFRPTRKLSGLPFLMRSVSEKPGTAPSLASLAGHLSQARQD